MNRHQSMLIAIATANIALMIAFPPYDAISITRGGASFDAFYFILDQQYNKQINSGLLYLEVMWVLINAGAAWLLLRGEVAGVAPLRRGIILFAVANAALLLLFPPFEAYSSLQRASLPTFDGFYFILGDKSRRGIYLPLLYIELFLLLVDVALAWLLFREPKPSTNTG